MNEHPTDGTFPEMDERDHEPLAEGEKPVCDCCAMGEEMVVEREREMMKTIGWYAHYVSDQPETPFHVNYHTHGLQHTFKHKDIQACLPIEFHTLHSIVVGLIEEIKAGKTFASGDISLDIIGNDFPVTFMDAKENGRDVLRIIFPDASGCLKKEEMEEPYGQQWKGTVSD